VLLRAIGPSVSVNGAPVAGRLMDPTLELHAEDGVLLTSNDDWKDAPNAADIQQSGAAPDDERESAILRLLAPGSYTAVMRGKDNSTGIGLAEVYGLGSDGHSQLANTSTRGFVGTGDNVMIGGFIVGNKTASAKVVVRALGPSLSSKGISVPLQNPTLELHDANGAAFASNDNWQDDPAAPEIESRLLAPPDARESATLQALTPGKYTAIVRGAGDSTGVALVEIYALN